MTAISAARREKRDRPTGVLLADAERLRLEIGGMTCASCAARVERKLNKLDGVTASVNYATEEAAVSFVPSRVAVAELIEAVEATGYTAALPHAHDEDEDPTRPLRLRLAVAVVLSVPLVVLAMVPPVRFAGWEWLAFALSAPVILWAGLGFHRAAVKNARHGSATMDTLISLGTLAAFGWSAVVLVGGLAADTYFEVGAVITALILSAATSRRAPAGARVPRSARCSSWA